MEHSYKNTMSTTQLAATIAKIAGFEAPQQADPAIDWLADLWIEKLGGKADNVLIFSADAVAAWLVRKYPEKFAKVWKYAPMMIPVRTVMPTVTPVDYAAFFSGALPEVNGVDRIVTPILSPELTQPLLTCDSLVAAAVRAGRKVCVVTCANGCIASMLSRSGADFCIVPGDDDAAMFDTAKAVVESGKYDFVFLYQLSYDYAQHAHGPEGTEALAALDAIIQRFEELYTAAEQCWQGNTLVMFHTDHGCHLEEDGHGHHGADIPEDTDIFHFWGGIISDSGGNL